LPNFVPRKYEEALSLRKEKEREPPGGEAFTKITDREVPEWEENNLMEMV